MTAAEKAEKLIMAHDGDMALLYIYYSRRKTMDISQAAKDLFMTLSRAETAYEKLELQGFFDGEKPSDETPPAQDGKEIEDIDTPRLYTTAEIEKASEDKIFKALLQEAELVMGKILTKDDISKLLDMYSHLGLSAEVIFVLLHYCELVSTRRPRMSYVQKVAYSWHQDGIESAEQAELFVENDLSRRSSMGMVKSALHIYDRDLTTKEREYACSWLDMDFTEDDIEQAYEICIDNKGKYIIAYINSVLENWHKNGKNDKKKIDKSGDASRPPHEASTLPTSLRRKKT